MHLHHGRPSRVMELVELEVGNDMKLHLTVEI